MPEHLTEQQSAVLAILADGRWHPVEEFMARHIPDYRKRLSEIGEAFPTRLDSRYRIRPAKGKSKSYRAKDWMDLEAYQRLASSVSDQLRILRAQDGGEAREMAGVVRLQDGLALKSVTWGQLRLYANAELTERLLADYVDPWSE
jgi:hypothetical protein